MRTDTPKTIYLKDYKPFPYIVKHIDLNFDIHDGYTVVTARTEFEKPHNCKDELFLNGEDMDLLSIKINEETLPGKRYTKTAEGLTILAPEEKDFTLEITTRIQPEKNTRLEGLYKSGDTYCTQCESEGFRRITYYPDRPDVLTTFTVRIEADSKKYPVLLSNGNRLEHGKAKDKQRHFATWHDPFPKPCYLFALVAGKLNHIRDEFITKSGRKVELYIYVRPGDEAQCDHAMEALKNSMKWDEDVYGLEYDLDLFNIVAVSDFNMGAMENKSLNIFNTALVLAHPNTATDGDFIRVESVIAHEYFHNWSGNRVTCRDWFQLSLKEGLTVFRDQEFSADMHSPAVQRIDDVTHLRRMQFPEDAGPLAHPIRPDNYIEINNFYTMTVYEKGAEVIRMMHTLMGPENYRKGTDLYFARHDGQAATCDDFVKCMEEASGMDLSQFKLWYSQAGTPEVHFGYTYNEDTKEFAMELSQIIPDTPGQTDKKPMHIPIKMALLSQSGKEMDLGGGETEKVFHLTEHAQCIEIQNIPEKPIPSILRNFSAPVRLKHDLTNHDLGFLMIHDTDGFNQWEASQTYILRNIQDMINKGTGLPACYIGYYEDLLDKCCEPGADRALIARLLTIPGVSRIGQEQKLIDPQKIHDVREAVIHYIGKENKTLSDKLETLNQQCGMSYEDYYGDFKVTTEAMGKRALKNVMREFLYDPEMLEDDYNHANNMTDKVSCLSHLTHYDHEARERVFDAFYQEFKDYQLVVDKWFSLQAISMRKTTISDLKNLRNHDEFNIRNPNRVRSLYAAFAMNNPVMFHRADGAGYDFLRDAIIELNEINPQIASRLLTPLKEWRRYTPDRQEKMKEVLEHIQGINNLSPDVFEIVSKSLK